MKLSSDSWAALTVGVILGGMVALAAGILGGCDDSIWIPLKPDCESGQAYHVDDELVCWSHDNTPFASRKWQASDTRDTACAFCEGFIR